MKALLLVIVSNGIPYLQMWSIGSHNTSEGEKEGKRRRTGSYVIGKLRKTSARRSCDEGCATRYRLKWGPLPANEVDSIAQHVRRGDGWKEERNGVLCLRRTPENLS